MSFNIEYCTSIELRVEFGVDFGIEVEVVLLMCADVIPSLFLIGHLYEIDVWLGEDQKSNTHKDTCLKEIPLHLQITLTTTHSIINTIEETCVSSQVINKHALMIPVIE